MNKSQSAALKVDGAAKHTSVCMCNKRFLVKTCNPLASVFSPTDETLNTPFCFEGYALVLVQAPLQAEQYGWCNADFCAAGVLFVAPGSKVALPLSAKGCAGVRLLLWSADVFNRGEGGDVLQNFGFLHYAEHEMLHLSAEENRRLSAAIDHVAEELAWSVDAFSADLLRHHIGVVLHLCRRYYTRQFITRHDACAHNFGKQVERCVFQYFMQGKGAACAQPSVQQVLPAEQHSPRYVADRVEALTGFRFENYVQGQRMKAAKALVLTHADEYVSAYLGFDSVALFRQMFALQVGMSTDAYRG